jgi:hypothetical protein
VSESIAPEFAAGVQPDTLVEEAFARLRSPECCSTGVYAVARE